MRRFLALLFSFIFLSIHPATAAEVLPQPFFNYLGSKYLANPGVILVDPSSNEVLYQSGADIPRTPASVLKLFTTASIALTLDSKTTFQTAIYKTDKRGVFVIWGENDPWITSSAKAANANQRAYMPKLIKAAFASDKKLKKIKLIYKGVNNSDIRDAKKALKRRASVTYQRIGKDVAVEEIVQEQLAVITSPPLNKMIRFALLYSDNVLSQRLAMLATGRNGYPLTEEGLNNMIIDKISTLGIDVTGMNFIDGSGLSRKNKVTALTISQLLLKIKTDPRLKSIYDHLPVSGETGTLITRYRETAPQAVGLVKAKTGSIRGVVSLAGFATSGEKEYVFVVLADEVGRTRAAQNSARKAIDRMLGTITKPPVIGITPPVPESTPFTTTQ